MNTSQKVMKMCGINARCRPKHQEHDIQAAVFRWAGFASATRPELRMLFAIPNGGARDSRTGAMLKAEGVKAGVPDICLPVARCGFHALYIELKTATGRVSEVQAEWHDALAKHGNKAVVCRSIDEAIKTLENYLDGHCN